MTDSTGESAIPEGKWSKAHEPAVSAYPHFERLVRLEELLFSDLLERNPAGSSDQENDAQRSTDKQEANGNVLEQTHYVTLLV